MASPTLSDLQKALQSWKAATEAKRVDIADRLAHGRPVSGEEEAWLDENGNFVEEDVILEKLQSASNISAALKDLNTSQRHAYDRLQNKVQDLKRLSAKRKAPTKKNDKKAVSPNHKSKAAGKTKARTTGEWTIATLEQRIEIIDWYHANGKNQSQTAKQFSGIYPKLKIKQPLVSAWIKDEAKWREEYDRHGAHAHRMKHARQTQHPEISDMMDLWVAKAMADGILLTGEVLWQKWRVFADLKGIPEDERLELSDGWLAWFKVWNGLKNFKRHGEAGSADPQNVEAERERMKGILTEYELRDIYNMDETGLFYG
ncbi:hypothetical protein IW261DRAFT_1334166 [Armillaria novae-zelandiae]|uniref:HTH CENPB-type domain-containing protein n=1 Tax=Armillaria novae-zelandiae TaxID=153914 RepID=A0AA39PCW8_9AGAR|nr:hypothetical protein IW261DRAFT_1334166 [Armillaria novae-zelandiae]